MTPGIKVFLGFAGILYPLMLLLVWNSAGDGDGLAAGFGALLFLGVLLNLGIALLLAGIKHGLTWWSYPVGVIACLYCLGEMNHLVELMRRDNVKWMIIMPALAPVVLCAYLCWATIPRVRGQLSPTLASLFVWVAFLALSQIPAKPYTQYQARIQAAMARNQAESQARIDEFNQLPADTPIPQLLPYLSRSETRWVAEAKIRASPRIQQDFESMMASGDYEGVHWLADYKITPTPSLCTSMRAFLRQRTVRSKAELEKFGYAPVADITPGIIQSLEYFADHNCALLPEFSDWLAVLEVHPDSTGMYLLPHMDKIKSKLESSALHPGTGATATTSAPPESATRR